MNKCPESLPVLFDDPKGRITVRLHGEPIRKYTGIAYDAITQSYVLVNLVMGFLEFLVSETLERAQLEAEYLLAKFA